MADKMCAIKTDALAKKTATKACTILCDSYPVYHLFIVPFSPQKIQGGQAVH